MHYYGDTESDKSLCLYGLSNVGNLLFSCWKIYFIHSLPNMLVDQGSMIQLKCLPYHLKFKLLLIIDQNVRFPILTIDYHMLQLSISTLPQM